MAVLYKYLVIIICLTHYGLENLASCHLENKWLHHPISATYPCFFSSSKPNFMCWPAQKSAAQANEKPKS